MKFIVNDKIYDTDKAEKVLDYRRSFPCEPLPQFDITCRMELYRTSKGNWFSVAHGGFGEMACIVNCENEVKAILQARNETDLYARYFDELEEA